MDFVSHAVIGTIANTTTNNELELNSAKNKNIYPQNVPNKFVVIDVASMTIDTIFDLSGMT